METRGDMETQRPASKRCVVLLSGGLDSAANLALAHERDEVVLALTADYGQRAAGAELRSAEALCRHYGVRHERVDLRWLGALGGSSLTGSGAVPSLGVQDLDRLEVTRETARAVWVPNRNGVLIHVAAAYAESLKADCVVVGFNREEAATFPDNTIEYLDRATRALEMSTSTGVIAYSYTASLDKKEIVAELRKLRSPFPFGLLWSCYQGGATPCGVCESCQRLTRALGSK